MAFTLAKMLTSWNCHALKDAYAVAEISYVTFADTSIINMTNRTPCIFTRRKLIKLHLSTKYFMRAKYIISIEIWKLN